ncbi:MAG: bacillithiol system redox-active protein YtxJ [Bacteroidia bacterium]|jgi:bacillithiol system protein YtxJ|nr:bacillithiol system redox-active protein YtxJ [Bacteroidia bacterium]
MNWIPFQDIDQLTDIDVLSHTEPILIFKHSTRCSISSTGLSRLEKQWTSDNQMKAYFVDLLAYRMISNAIADHYGITHQSPQALVIKNGKCVYHESHLSIAYEEIISH